MDAVGRVPHPSPTRDAASNPVACALVPCLNFFLFFFSDSRRLGLIRADLASIHAKSS